MLQRGPQPRRELERAVRPIEEVGQRAIQGCLLDDERLDLGAELLVHHEQVRSGKSIGALGFRVVLVGETLVELASVAGRYDVSIGSREEFVVYQGPKFNGDRQE